MESNISATSTYIEYVELTIIALYSISPKFRNQIDFK